MAALSPEYNTLHEFSNICCQKTRILEYLIPLSLCVVQLLFVSVNVRVLCIILIFTLCVYIYELVSRIHLPYLFLDDQLCSICKLK